MTADETVYPPYFTLAGYRAILERAQHLGYRTACFRSFVSPEEAPDAAPVLLLRHDLDHSLRSALPLAELEAERGAEATYFVQVTCDFYNLLSAESRHLVRRLVTLGHEIGLHYDASRYTGERAEARLRLDLALLEDLAGQAIVSASQHIPIDSERIDVSAFVEHEAYEARFMDGTMTYISDSLMAWRQARPHELLAARRSFQLLTHPETWTGTFASMEEALAQALAEECAALQTGFSAVEARYRWLLKNRARLDAAFEAQRARRAPA